MDEDDDFLDKAVEGYYAGFKPRWDLYLSVVCAGTESIYDEFIKRVSSVLKPTACGQSRLDTDTRLRLPACIPVLKILSYLDWQKKASLGWWVCQTRWRAWRRLLCVKPTIWSAPMICAPQEEIWPVLAATKFKDDEEAMSIANDTL